VKAAIANCTSNSTNRHPVRRWADYSAIAAGFEGQPGLAKLLHEACLEFGVVEAQRQRSSILRDARRGVACDISLLIDLDRPHFLSPQ
jgi:hypothetical protein